jgi:thiosulfate/3-mercaptopyruvate sulfurtransferase
VLEEATAARRPAAKGGILVCDTGRYKRSAVAQASAVFSLYHVPMLVTAQELAAHLQDPDWVSIDCRFDLARPEAGEAAYRASHIPGAVYAHLDRDLSAPRTAVSGRHPLPDPVRLASLFSSWSIHPGTTVVAYDDAGGAYAARLWWLLRWMGHDKVGLLDGGLSAWQAAGLPLTTAVPERRSSQFAGRAGSMPTIDTSGVEQSIARRGLRLLDARSANRFHGRDETIDPVAGHIPGAISAPFQENLTPDGRFRGVAELRARFDRLLQGAATDQTACMCGSGVTACHNLFAMELAGLTGARLYPGSWSEWIRSPQRPVATD